MNKQIIAFAALFTSFSIFAQQHWQQHVSYAMDVEMDVKTYQYDGVQEIIYTNNSPDTLKQVFYHLYYNAFRPNSTMAVRLKNGKDRNTRFNTDLDTLAPKDYGKLVVSNLKQDGVPLKPIFAETILQVPLKEPLAPGGKTKLSLDFSGQLPAMIRRAGKNSEEGVAISMAQWYPKLAEYDYEGWNAAPYIGREFHGVWGDFNVKITLDKSYTVAASGYLQNPEKIGHGYSKNTKSKARKGKLTWHFIAPKVHDFTWAADPDYIHETYPGPNGVTLRFFYKNTPEIIENWRRLQPKTAEFMRFYNNTIGPYPYKEYNVVQGGDGGMEYAMLTLITGGRDFRSLAGVTAHELAHSWFQHVLATNEMKHEWMDEGFTSYISTLAEDFILEENLPFPLISSYEGYFTLARSGVEQSQASNANRYDYNLGYERSAYSKGAVFLAQLGYIIGNENLAKTLKAYYNEFKFKHPFPNDFRRVAERISGLQLQWYLTEWTQTTNTIDYGIKSVKDVNNKTDIQLERIGRMPMPQDILVILKDGTQKLFYIPFTLMRGKKKNPYALPWTVLKDWTWAQPYYTISLDIPKAEIETVVIDPTGFMADIDRSNNYYYSESRN